MEKFMIVEVMLDFFVEFLDWICEYIKLYFEDFVKVYMWDLIVVGGFGLLFCLFFEMIGVKLG